MKKKKLVLFQMLVAMMLMVTPIHGEEPTENMGLTFSGESEKFITYQQDSAYENMAPGEERIQKVTLTNDDYRELKFFVRSEYTNPLGEGVANGQIAYDIEFSNNGEVFYSGKIGGVTQANMDSLEQNYLLKTLSKGETTTIDMKIKVDGDSMDNSYQNTEGYLKLIFSVEHEDSTPVEKVITVLKEIPVLNQLPGVNTGDTTAVGALLGVFGGSVLIIIVLVIMKLRKRKDEGHEGN